MTIDRDPLRLHPLVRDAVAKTLASCKAAGLPFAMFEGYRSPVRQAVLYAQGRTAPGPIVTYARPGESHHNFGMAADLCGFVDGHWTWDLPDSAWRTMAAFGKTWGLETLSFERPHLQWAKARLSDLQSGIYPVGGDETWQAAVGQRPPLTALAAKPEVLSEADILNQTELGRVRSQFFPP